MRGKPKPSQAAESPDRPDEDEVREAAATGDAAEPTAEPPAGGESAGTGNGTEDVEVIEAEVIGAEVIETADGEPDAVVEEVTDAQVVEEEQGSNALGAELGALRSDLDEMTRDLQRVSAEYANYRRRVERDRSLAAEQVTGALLAALLPVLDDLDRAREHGDLKGPFGSVAEQLTTTLGKFGLVAFGEKGEKFDPTRHEAVAHQTSPDVTEPSCVEVMRRGYMLGERLLRPALVAVADPE